MDGQEAQVKFDDAADENLTLFAQALERACKDNNNETLFGPTRREASRFYFRVFPDEDKADQMEAWRELELGPILHEMGRKAGLKTYNAKIRSTSIVANGNEFTLALDT